MTTPKHTPGDVDAAIRAAAKRGADLRRTPGTKQRLLCGCEIRLGIESMSLVQCPMHAAAPDLLEAAALVQQAESSPMANGKTGYTRPTETQWRAIVDASRAAISKARGGES